MKITLCEIVTEQSEIHIVNSLGDSSDTSAGVPLTVCFSINCFSNKCCHGTLGLLYMNEYPCAVCAGSRGHMINSRIMNSCELLRSSTLNKGEKISL